MKALAQLDGFTKCDHCNGYAEILFYAEVFSYRVTDASYCAECAKLAVDALLRGRNTEFLRTEIQRLDLGYLLGAGR